MKMHDAMRIVARRMHGSVDTEADGIYFDVGIAVYLSVNIDLDQTRRRDFVETQAEGIDQESTILIRNARRDMCVDQVAPALACSQSVSSSQIDAQRLFSRRDRRGRKTVIGSEGKAHGGLDGSGIIGFQAVILPVLMSEPKQLPPLEREFLVVCLCAAWCGTCREYEEGFRELQASYPDVGFIWVDIEDENSGVEDWDIDNFPTLLIQRNELVLFFGPMLPHHRVLLQTVEAYLTQSLGESHYYVHATPERAGWQGAFDFRSLKRSLG